MKTRRSKIDAMEFIQIRLVDDVVTVPYDIISKSIELKELVDIVRNLPPSSQGSRQVILPLPKSDFMEVYTNLAKSENKRLKAQYKRAYQARRVFNEPVSREAKIKMMKKLVKKCNLSWYNLKSTKTKKKSIMNDFLNILETWASAHAWLENHLSVYKFMNADVKEILGDLTSYPDTFITSSLQALSQLFR